MIEERLAQQRMWFTSTPTLEAGSAVNVFNPAVEASARDLCEKLKPSRRQGVEIDRGRKTRWTSWNFEKWFVYLNLSSIHDHDHECVHDIDESNFVLELMLWCGWHLHNLWYLLLGVLVLSQSLIVFTLGWSNIVKKRSRNNMDLQKSGREFEACRNLNHFEPTPLLVKRLETNDRHEIGSRARDNSYFFFFFFSFFNLGTATKDFNCKEHWQEPSTVLNQRKFDSHGLENCFVTSTVKS